MFDENEATEPVLRRRATGFDTQKHFSDLDRNEIARERILHTTPGLATQEDVLSEQSLNTPMLTNIGVRKRNSTGVLGELVKGVGRGIYNTGHGIINTVEELRGKDGPGTLSYELNEWAATHQASFIGRPEYRGVLDWSASMIGEQAPFMASIALSGGATGALATAMKLGVAGTKALTTVGALATVSAITYGDNVDGIRQAAGGRLTEAQIHAMGIGSTIVQSVLEVALGPEAQIGKATALNAIAKSGVPYARMVAAAETKGLFRNGFRGWLGQIAAESLTEVSQAITQNIWEDVAAGPGVQMRMEDLQDAIYQGLAAIPSSALFGGISMYAEHRVRQGIIDRQRGMDADREAVVAGKSEADAARIVEESTAAFTKFGEAMSDRFGSAGGQALAQVIEEQAYHWAAETGREPSQYINDFQFILTNTTLTSEQVQKVRSIKDPNERVKWMRNNVQGYRAFESTQRENYRTSAIEKQYAEELNRYRSIFGDDFAAEFVGNVTWETGDAVVDQVESDQKQSPTPEEQAQRAMNRRTQALSNLYDLRQEALKAVDNVKIDNRDAYRLLVTTTRQSASDMFRSLYDPDENTNWITPAKMRRTLADLIYVNNGRISREDAYAIVEKLGDRRIEQDGVQGRSELEAAFMLEAALGENVWHYRVDELSDALRVLKGNDAMWRNLSARERGFVQYQAMMDAAKDAGASSVQQAEIALSQANSIFSRSRMGGNIAPDLSVSIEAIETLASALRQEILDGANMNVIGEMTDALNKNIEDLMLVVDQRKGEEQALFRALREMTDVMEAGEGNVRWAEYDPASKIAVFYANATAEDVLHEWFHYVDMSGLLPERLQRAMDETYGINSDSTPAQRTAAREKAARDFVKYLQHVANTGANKKVATEYPDSMEDTFAYLREVLASLHAEEGIPEVQSAESVVESGAFKPAVITEEQAATESERLGIVFNGFQQGVTEDQQFAMFTDSETGSTFVVLEGQTVEDALTSKRAEFDERPALSSEGGIQYKPEVRDFFKGAFDNASPEAHHEMAAKILEQQMLDNPPQVEEWTHPLESASMAAVEDVDTLRNAAHLNGRETFEKLVNKLLGNTEYTKGDWNSLSIEQKREVAQRSVDIKAKTSGRYTLEQLDEMAQAVNPNAEGWKDLSEAEQHQVRSALASINRAESDQKLADVMKATKREELDRLADAKLRELFPELMDQAKINPAIRESSVGPEVVAMKDRLLSDIPAKFKRFGAWVQSKTNDFYAMIDYLADGKIDSGWHKLLSDPMRRMNHEWGKVRHETEGWLVEDTDKHGAHPIGNEWSKVYEFGNERKRLTMREAVYIYMYTDRGRAAEENKALFGSNKSKLGNDPDSVLRDIITLVDGGANGQNKAYTKYVKHIGPNDYLYSDKPKDGYTKTFPLKNWARTQMDYMRRIHPLLDAAHFERTGKHLGNLFVDKNGKKHEFIAPSMRIGERWRIGSGLTDLFVVDEEARAKLVQNMFGGQYGQDVTIDMLKPEEKQQVFEQEDMLHSDERGTKARKRGDGRSQTVGATQARARGLVGAELMMDAPYIFAQYQEHADIYRAKYKTLDYLDNITSKESFRNVLRGTIGEEKLEIVHNALREMIERERFPQGRSYVDSDFDRWVRHVQGRVMPAILGARASSMAMQAASGPRVLAEIHLRDAPRFLLNSAKVMKQIGGNTHRLVDAMMMRDNLLTGDTEVGRWFQHMLESSPEIVRRMIGPDVMDFYASAQKGSGMANMKVGRGTLTDFQMGGFRVMDMSTVLTAYHTSYESKVAELRRSSVMGGKAMTDAQIEKAATDFAEHVVNITQPASTITDRNLLQTARPTVRMWFPFTGDRMKQFTYINRQIIAPLARGWRDNNVMGVLEAMTTRKYSSQPAAKRIMFMGLLPMTIVSLIKRRRPPEDWEEWREDMLGLSVSTLPLIGPIFQNALTSNYEIDGTPVALMPVMASAKAMRSLKNDGLFDDEGHLNEYGVEQFARAAFTHEGLPVVGIDFISEMAKMMIDSDAIAPDERTTLEKVLSAMSLKVAPAPDRTNE